MRYDSMCNSGLRESKNLDLLCTVYRVIYCIASTLTTMSKRLFMIDKVQSTYILSKGMIHSIQGV